MDHVPHRSIPAMLKANARQFSDKPALSYKKDGAYRTLTYLEFYERVLMAARGLREAGIKPGDRVAIFSENRTGWAIADFAIQAVQAVTVPIYATSTAEQAAYVLNHSAARIVFISSRLQYEKLLSVMEKLPTLEMAVSFDRFMGRRELQLHTLQQLSAVSDPLSTNDRGDIEALIDDLTPDHLITLIYTSGTTGTPKGVMLTQYNVLHNVHYGLEKLEAVGMNETFLSFLPLSHVLERTAGYYAPLMTGSQIAFCESVEKVVQNIQEVRPTVMVSVPRLFEKIYGRIYEDVHKMPALRRNIFHWATDVGREYIHRRYITPRPLGMLRFYHRLCDRLVFRKIRSRFGGRLRYFISGGAPLDKTINEFMWIIGIPTFEGYGLTETSPALTINSPWKVRFGSVGTPLRGTELRLAADGELEVRGPQVMRGYYAAPEETEQVLKDGWFSTGDICRIDEDGYLYIIDRKKEIIITAGGKNIAPQPLESALRMDKLVSQSFVFGDRKPYLVALLTPNLERLLEIGKEQGIDFLDVEELVVDPRINRLYTERVAKINSQLAPYESIKKFIVLPRDFSVEGGELTATLKLRRKMIYEKYRDRIESLYLQENGAPRGEPDQANGGTP